MDKHTKYNNSEKGKKRNRIQNWKKRGVIFFDYNLLHDIYINTHHCDLCNIKLTENDLPLKTTSRCLDHDHNITEFDNVRGILCNSCNAKLTE